MRDVLCVCPYIDIGTDRVHFFVARHLAGFVLAAFREGKTCSDVETFCASSRSGSEGAWSPQRATWASPGAPTRSGTSWPAITGSTGSTSRAGRITGPSSSQLGRASMWCSPGTTSTRWFAWEATCSTSTRSPSRRSTSMPARRSSSAGIATSRRRTRSTARGSTSWPRLAFRPSRVVCLAERWHYGVRSP